MRYGRTWWGKRWLRTLEQLGLTYPDNRIVRARTLVKNDAVDLMHTEPGELSAWVDVPRKSFGVSINLPVFSTAQWEVFDRVTASQLGNLADLLDDRLPASIDKQLAPSGMSLFPADGELATDCPCSDRSAVCVHVIAVQHAFAAEFDDDPFLLPLLRGREREEFIAGIRAARSDRAPVPIPPDAGIPIEDLPVAEFFTASGDLDTLAR